MVVPLVATWGNSFHLKFSLVISFLLRYHTHARIHVPSGSTPLRPDAQQAVNNQGQSACLAVPRALPTLLLARFLVFAVIH
jgi:hypothetical protein